MKKIVVLTCTHAPYIFYQLFDNFLKFVKDYNPDAIYHLGDLGDFSSVSGWNVGKRGLQENERINKDIQDSLDILTEINKVVTPSTQRVLLYGNHEQRLAWYLDRHPELEGSINFPQMVREEGWGVFPYGRPMMIAPNLYITHGWRYNKYHAQAMLDDLGVNVVYGHTHRVQTITKQTINGTIQATSIGCMTKQDQHRYAATRPKSWDYGFATIEVINDVFNVNVIRANNSGEFVANGKAYL